MDVRDTRTEIQFNVGSEVREKSRMASRCLSRAQGWTEVLFPAPALQCRRLSVPARRVAYRSSCRALEARRASPGSCLPPWWLRAPGSTGEDCTSAIRLGHLLHSLPLVGLFTFFLVYSVPLLPSPPTHTQDAYFFS